MVKTYKIDDLRNDQPKNLTMFLHIIIFLFEKNIIQMYSFFLIHLEKNDNSIELKTSMDAT